MRNMLLLCIAVLLVGCQTVPVTSSFPEAPATLMRPCEDLSTIEQNEVKFSVFLKVVTSNYKKSHNCADKVVGWQDWYLEQKKIYEKAQSKANSVVK